VAPGSLTCEISRRPCWHTFYLGLGINAAAVLLVIAIDPQLRTSALPEPEMTSHYVTLVSPYTRPPVISTPPARIPITPTVAKLERPRLALPPTPVEPAKLPLEVAKAQPAPVEVAPVAPEKAPTKTPVTPAAPVRHVNTNVFASEKSELTVVQQPARKVQTGGFGDPNGLPGQGDPKRQTVTATNVGSFDLPAGAGKGNGAGGSQGMSGKIRTSGFGDASRQPVLEAQNENVTASGFGDSVAQTKSVVSQQVALQPRVQPVEILFKPRPTYTPEARRLGVQGEVLLDVVFEASGALQIKRVVKGLGHGLDDMALAAARQIQFRPALRDGQPYDYAALVHIRFELAD
jgi:TonB family protein